MRALTSSQTVTPQSAFTLIEVSIVLVIIGLIIGGVLTGRDLINTALVRVQISQLDKYNTAAHNFDTKYGYLPGDIPDPYASNYGFVARGIGQGTGNGDGIIGGAQCNGGAGCTGGGMQGAGETVLFWRDLAQAGFIDGSFTTATAYTRAGADVTGSAINNYIPSARIGQGNYVYVWGGGTYTSGWNYSGVNYFGISAVSNIASNTNYGKPVSKPAITVTQAYNIDKKIDDGYPTTGNVIAVYVTTDPIWADPNSDGTIWATYNWTQYPISGSSTTCFDSGGVNAVQQYSLSQNSGNGLNCGLSFVMQ